MYAKEYRKLESCWIYHLILRGYIVLTQKKKKLPKKSEWTNKNWWKIWEKLIPTYKPFNLSHLTLFSHEFLSTWFMNFLSSGKFISCQELFEILNTILHIRARKALKRATCIEMSTKRPSNWAEDSAGGKKNELDMELNRRVLEYELTEVMEGSQKDFPFA